MLIFTFFLLLEGNRVAQWVLLVVPRDRRPGVRSLFLDLRDRVSRWVLAAAIYSAFSGVVVSGAMVLLGIPTPWFFGVGAALLALIPGIGPASISTLAIVASIGLSTWQPIAVAVFGIVLYVHDASVIAPKIFGNKLRLPMLVVFLAILLGAELLGVWGAILALPVAVATQMVLLELPGRRTRETA